MEIVLYKCTEDNKKIGKTLLNGFSINGTFRGECDIKTPSINVTAENVLDYNYCFIKELKRYYFITKVNIFRNGVYNLELKLDVLKTYENDIKKAQATITTSETPRGFIQCALSDEVSNIVYNYEDKFNKTGTIVLVTATGY